MPTNFGPASDAASAVTTRLALTFGSCVTPLHVIDLDLNSAAVDRYRSIVDQREMAPLIATLARDNVDVAHAVVVTGSVVDQILRKADELDVDLIVMGAGDRRDDGAFVPSPVAESVIQQARQPVLAVLPGELTPVFQQILCPIDGSRTSLRGLKNAIRLAQAFQSKLTVLSVVPEVHWLTAAAEDEALSNVQEHYADLWKKDFYAVLNEVDFGGVTWSEVVRQGSPGPEILATAAENQHDLIVIGATGKTGVTRVLLGSTARLVVQKLPCSLLVVHDEDMMLEPLTTEDVLTSKLAYNAADTLLADRAWEAALRKFDQILARNPFHIPALVGRADACEGLGQHERAVRCRQRAEILRNETWTLARDKWTAVLGGTTK